MHLLREVSLFRKKFGLSGRLPNLCGDSVVWPNDLEDKDDLSSSLTDMSLRDDIKRFIWNILDEAIPSEKYYIIHYYGAIKSKTNVPIIVEVVEDYLEIIKEKIATISHRLRTCNYENLLPDDLIEIKGVRVGDSITFGHINSGEPTET